MTLWRRIFLFHILAAALALGATAHAQSCIDPFTAPAVNPLRLPQEGLLSPHETQRIRKALSSDKPGRERWTEAANIYLDARVRQFPPEHRDALRKMLSRFRPQFSNRDFEAEATSKKMVYPEHYVDTPLPYVIMTHEWEHLIRSYARSSGRDEHAGGFNYMFNPVAMYREEGAAIWAEWELARFVSAKEATDVTRLASGLSRDKKFVTYVETIVTNRGLERPAYLSAVRDSGRYSVANVIKKTSTSTAIAGATASYVSGFCGFIYWILH